MLIDTDDIGTAEQVLRGRAMDIAARVAGASNLIETAQQIYKFLLGNEKKARSVVRLPKRRKKK